MPGQVLQGQRVIGSPGDKATVSVAADIIFASLCFLFMYVLMIFCFIFCFSGVEQSRLVGAGTTVFTIDGQQPEEGLVISVAALVDQRVGEVATLSPRPAPSSESVSGLRVVGISSQRIRIVWSPSFRASGYKIKWRHENGKKWLASIVWVLQRKVLYKRTATELNALMQ